VTERPSAESLATIAIETAAVARRLGQEPRVAFLSYSNFGNPRGEFVDNVRGAVQLLDNQQVGFEYEGEMSADVALNPAMRAQYPFNRLSGPANVLIMPGLHSANIAAKLIKEVANLRVVGPMLVNMSKPVQIVPMNSSASDIVTLGVLASTGVVC
jgi:malate dehydrogenase (oxaloacetate-decarboxylating)(NADP+)